MHSLSTLSFIVVVSFSLRLCGAPPASTPTLDPSTTSPQAAPALYPVRNPISSLKVAARLGCDPPGTPLIPSFIPTFGFARGSPAISRRSPLPSLQRICALPSLQDQVYHHGSRRGGSSSSSSSSGVVSLCEVGNDDRLKGLLRGSGTRTKARDVREAVAGLEDSETDLGRDTLLLMMRACGATGEWRRCLSLRRRNGGECSEALSVCIGACARWGANGEVWRLLKEAEEGGARGGIAASAALRAWMSANDMEEGSKTKVRGTATVGGKQGSLRAVRGGGGKRGGGQGVDSGELKAACCELVRDRVPESVVKRLVGHTGPSSVLAQQHSISAGEARVK